MKETIMLNSKDNVATALKQINENEQVTVVSSSKEVISRLQAKQEIPFGHKISLTEITKGEPVIKFGERIGTASQNISVGEYVHVHNVESDIGK
ncbi:MAG: UxaA family hydrolase [Desulfobacteraceae bacterium]|nr:UxaA family hydrolase [Desulfobacteraceae bacterium]